MNATRRRVLLADDHSENLRVLERLVARPSVEVLRATDGGQALALARQEHPDLVVLDVCMPVLDGLEVCEAIRQDPALAHARVILVSAIVGETALRESSDDLGADGYFAKPFDVQAVRHCMNALLTSLDG